MRDSEFEFIRTLVYERSRISLDHRKRELVAARLAKRLRANRLETVADYCRMLQSPDQEDERVRLIDAISTNHTFFFRERSHFDLIRDKILPEMAARAPLERWPRFHAWCAACSSGEEPYSLAMTLADGLRDRAWPWQVEATDISHRMLEVATRAVYREKTVTSHAPAWSRVHFQRGIGPQHGNYRVKADLRRGVNFRQLNLLEGALPFTAPFQLILCRNVMIYFDRPTQEELVRKLTRQLVPGGYLLVGHSESLTGIPHSLQLSQTSVYRRPPAQP